MSEENKNVRCDLCGEEISSQNAIRFDGTINLADEEFQTMTWKEFAKTVSVDKAELKEYLKIRGLEE